MPEASFFLFGPRQVGKSTLLHSEKPHLTIDLLDRVVLSSTNKEKETVIKNIFNTYLLREINQILNYRDEFKLTRLINALGLHIGSSVIYKRYWRTKSKAEVDFIIEDQGDVIPLEVKTTLNKPSVSRSFRSFLEKYQPPRGLITSQLLYNDVRVNGIPVSIVPHWYLDPRGV